MSYKKCPQCPDDRAVDKGDGIVVCYSCQTPLKAEWLEDNWTVFTDWSAEETVEPAEVA